ncbi:MAG: DUF4338 domain-containing protein, partial [Candidatus Rokubacteria bacterium]|nr:DUF4338 domain-containing protein [Candidatus Rokubacteria bacterium]
AKDFRPKLINATVVLRWDGAPKAAEKEVVILTTDPAADPFVAFDAYDDRSLIENPGNRDAKERWWLENTWLCLGDTQGRGKRDTAHAYALPFKSVWVCPLAKRFRQALTE